MRVNAETKNATRARILAVAEKQFAERGFAETTTRDIARVAKIATGTLFNYFPTKEAIVASLASDAYAQVAGRWAATESETSEGTVGESTGDREGLEVALFDHIARTLRMFRPYRTYLPAVLETSFSPLSTGAGGDDVWPMRSMHLEAVGGMVGEHWAAASFSSVAAQLYWTLYLGILKFWSTDRSRRQEDTLALVDESLNMFVRWLTESEPSQSAVEPRRKSKRKRG